MSTTLTARQLAALIHQPSIKGITLAVSQLIRESKLAAGTQLPAVRELAEALGVSPATVSAAWQHLRRQSVLAGKGRSGVWVCGNSVSARPVRFEKIGNYGKGIIADLTMASPDPQLLPDLEQALRMAVRVPELNSYRREPITPSLRAAIIPDWPVESEAFLATDGGFDAMYLALRSLISPGERVMIENPTATRLLDMLDYIGAEALPVPCDQEGPLPDAVAALLQQAPRAFIYQPRTHSASGHTVSRERSDSLSKVLADSKVLIIEDDGIGELSAHPVWSLGRYYPRRTVHVRSYSKAYGPDLRLAVVSGPLDLIEQLQSLRNFGASWTSRLLQEAVAWMIQDEGTRQSIQWARRIYAERRRALLSALAQRGLSLPDRDGLSLYVPVRSEQFAMITLAAHGIAAVPGERCSTGGEQFIRISTCRLDPKQVDHVADALMLACDLDTPMNGGDRAPDI
ncbi:PLP-dependent aminotransferase family protein [Sodalis sp. RH15]|uniref:aminotransferase-like domain-containing protein n=1 Tax=Sodalis sp. RH15 TaxID=3394330 RepID=UPI0039B4CAC4